MSFVLENIHQKLLAVKGIMSPSFSNGLEKKMHIYANNTHKRIIKQR